MHTTRIAQAAFDQSERYRRDHGPEVRPRGRSGAVIRARSRPAGTGSPKDRSGIAECLVHVNERQITLARDRQRRDDDGTGDRRRLPLDPVEFHRLLKVASPLGATCHVTPARPSRIAPSCHAMRVEPVIAIGWPSSLCAEKSTDPHAIGFIRPSRGVNDDVRELASRACSADQGPPAAAFASSCLVRTTIGSSGRSMPSNSSTTVPSRSRSVIRWV